MAMPTRGSMPRAAYATTQTLDKQKSQPSYLESANKSYKIAKDYEIPFFFLCLSESNSCISVFSINGNGGWSSRGKKTLTHTLGETVIGSAR